MRLAALTSYQVLDTAPERAFDNIAAIAAALFETPMALVSLVDRERQWFKARVGLDATETPRDVAFCAHAIRQDEPLVVPDAALDPRFAIYPLVTGRPHLRFYAGAPVLTPDGLPLGTLCVLDTRPRPAGLTDGETAVLVSLARQVSSELEVRRLLAERDRMVDRLRAAEMEMRDTAERMALAVRATRVGILDIDWRNLLTAGRRGLVPVLQTGP